MNPEKSEKQNLHFRFIRYVDEKPIRVHLIISSIAVYLISKKFKANQVYFEHNKLLLKNYKTTMIYTNLLVFLFSGVLIMSDNFFINYSIFLKYIKNKFLK